jgi:myosin heavy subunit
MSKIHQIANGTLEIFDDGTKLQKTNDGITLLVKPDGTKVQTSPNGSRLTVRPNGTKFQESADGTTLFIDTDGTQTTTHISGVVVILYTDGRKRQTDQFGVITDVAANGNMIRTKLDGTKFEKRGNRCFKHLADGSIIEVDPSNGNVIGVERAASTPEAKAAVDEAKTAKKLKEEELKNVYQTNLSRHRDKQSGAWYEHDKLTGTTRWLSAEESEEQNKTDAVTQAVTAMKMAEARALDVETKSKHSLEEMLIKLNDKKQEIIDLKQQISDLQEDVQRRHNAHVASNKQYETHMAHTVKELTDQIDTLKKNMTNVDPSIQELSELKKKHYHLFVENESNKSNLATTTGTLLATEKQLNLTSMKVKDLKKELSTCLNDKRMLSRKYDEVVDRAGNLAEEMTAMQEVMDLSADTYAESLQEIGRLEANLLQVTKERDEALSRNSNQSDVGGGSVVNSTEGSNEENIDFKSKMFAAERMSEVTIRKLSALQKETGQQRTLLEEMQTRLNSSDTMMRRQRTAINDYKEKVEQLRDDLRIEAEKHLHDSQKQIQYTEKLKEKLTSVYEELDKKAKAEEEQEKELKEREEAKQWSSGKIDAAGKTMMEQSGRIYDLQLMMTEKDEKIASLRNEVASLHKQISKMNEHRESLMTENNDAIALDAMSFFDMDHLGLHDVDDKSESNPPPPKTPQSAPQSGTHGRRRGSSVISFCSQTVDQDNIGRLLSLRESSRRERNTALQGLLSVPSEE